MVIRRCFGLFSNAKVLTTTFNVVQHIWKQCNVFSVSSYHVQPCNKIKNPANFPWLFPRIYIHSICQFMFDLSYMSNDISFPCDPISCILQENKNTCTHICCFYNVHLYNQKLKIVGMSCNNIISKESIRIQINSTCFIHLLLCWCVIWYVLSNQNIYIVSIINE